jgi:hypothetical protein
MKRVAVLLGLAAAAPSVAQAQLPVAPATPPAEAPAAPPPSAPAAPEHAQPPGDQYFVEQAPPAPPAPAPGPEATEPAPFEPPPPPIGFEPPPPPLTRHVAPERSLWLSARLGWFFPFGNVWSRARPVSTSVGSGYVLEGVPWRDYASSGPMIELDVGVRLSRSYTLFALWERAQLGSGNDTSVGKPNGAESDFWAAGLRASSNPDGLGFLTEVAVGYRRARSFYENDFEVQFTDAPFEARLGLGGELRLNRMTSFSGLVTIGVGGFGDVQTVAPNGSALSRTRPEDEGDGHAWATLNIGAHFDLLPTDN